MVSSVIVKNSEILGGVLVFAGTCVPFQVLLDHLDYFPTVTRVAAMAGSEEAKALLLAQLK